MMDTPRGRCGGRIYTPARTAGGPVGLSVFRLNLLGRPGLVVAQFVFVSPELLGQLGGTLIDGGVHILVAMVRDKCTFAACLDDDFHGRLPRFDVQDDFRRLNAIKIRRELLRLLLGVFSNGVGDFHVPCFDRNVQIRPPFLVEGLGF